MSKKKQSANPKKSHPKAPALDPEIAKRLAEIAPTVAQSTHEHQHGLRLSKEEIRSKTRFHRPAQSAKVTKDGIGAKKV